MSRFEEKVSRAIRRISNHLDTLRFTGMDQNPKGIRDDLFIQERRAMLMEVELEETKEKLNGLNLRFSNFWVCDADGGFREGMPCVYTHGGEECIYCGAPEERK